jgi:hypothetical protein
METYKLQVTEAYFSNEPNIVTLGFGGEGEGGFHTPVEEMKEIISDINMVVDCWRYDTLIPRTS